MSISQAIAKSQGGGSSSSGSSSKPVDNLERQLDAAEFYGVIKPDNPQPGPKKRGRPPSKSKSPARAAGSIQDNIPEEFPKQSPGFKNIDAVLDKMNRTRLLTKLRAYNAYWPDICPLSPSELGTLSVPDMERLIEMFELSVNSFSEIVDIPQSIKATIAKVEPFAISMAAANPDNYWLSKGRYMAGFTGLMQRDPNVDRNVKLLSIRLLGKVPRHPLISLIYHLCGIAFHVVSINEARANQGEVAEEYNEL